MTAPSIRIATYLDLVTVTGLWIVPAERMLIRDGFPLQLGPVAFRIAWALTAAYPRLLDHLELWDFVYGDRHDGGPTDHHTLTVWVSLVRPRLAPLGIGIDAFHGMGWRATIAPAPLRVAA